MYSQLFLGRTLLGPSYMESNKESKERQGPTRGMLTIYTNHPGRNLVHKRKTIKFDMAGE